jgi:hypothetical protein
MGLAETAPTVSEPVATFTQTRALHPVASDVRAALRSSY